jgi:hypothetical protein
MRAPSLTLAFLALLGVAAMVSPASARRPRCHLTGPNLVHSRIMKIVSRTTADGTDRLLGCVYSVGRTHVLAAQTPQTESSELTVKRVAGPWVITSASALGHVTFSLELRAVDVRTGRGYLISLSSSSGANPTASGSPAAYQLNDRGFSAVVLEDSAATGTTRTVTARRVLLFNPRGRERQLDSAQGEAIVPSSLILDEHTVLWTNSGLVKFARF